MDPNTIINSSTFCPAPWMEMHLTVGRKIKPCCAYTEHNTFGDLSNGSSIFDVYNSKQAKLARKELSSDIEHAGCRMCFDSEKLHGESRRLKYLERWTDAALPNIFNTNDDFSLKDTKFKVLDLRSDNKCNLKCRICSSQYSTSWIKETEQLNKIPGIDFVDTTFFAQSVDDNVISFVKSNLPSLDTIMFAGGEPLIQDIHYEILQHAIDTGVSQNINLFYNTNFSTLTYKGIDVRNLWSKFKDIVVLSSLDDNHKRGEYQRKNLKWEDVIKNRVALQECDNIRFGLNITISIFNIFNIPEFLNEWNQLNYLQPNFNDVNLQFLEYPRYLNVVNLPDNFKKEFTDKYLDYIEQSKDKPELVMLFNYVIRGLNQDRIMSEEKWRSSFFNHTNAIDKLRNENFKTIFTEYTDL